MIPSHIQRLENETINSLHDLIARSEDWIKQTYIVEAKEDLCKRLEQYKKALKKLNE
jgi:hypothetical protein